MDCPFCGKTMRRGGISADEGSLEWLTDGNEGPESGLEDRVLLTCAFSPEVEAFYCPDCRQMIVPVPELETVPKMLRETVDLVTDTVTDGVKQLRKDWEARRAERREEMKWKKRKGKDPWEW